MQARLLTTLILLVSVGMIVSLSNTSISTAQTSLSICDFVERFKVIDRPPQITAGDIVWLAALPDFGSGTIDEFRSLIQTNGPITRAEQLDLLPSRNVSSKMKFLLRVLFNLSGEDTCTLRV